MLKNIVLKCAEDVFLYLCGRFIPYLRLADGCLVCDCRSAWLAALALVRARWFKLSSAWLNRRPDKFSSMTSTRQRSVFMTSAETSQSFHRFTRLATKSLDSFMAWICCVDVVAASCNVVVAGSGAVRRHDPFQFGSVLAAFGLGIMAVARRGQWQFVNFLPPLSTPSSSDCHSVIPLFVRHVHAAVVSGEDEACC